MSDVNVGNADQIAHWNGETTEKWLGNREALDRSMACLTDRLVAIAAPAAGEKVLDVGCGTGDLGRRIAAAVSPDGEVLGLDVSAPMLAEAARLAPANLRTREGDAQSVSLPPGAFDLVASRFGIMFFADPVAAFTNIRSAIRPGGRLAVVCWAPLANNPWFALPLGVAARHFGPPPTRPPRAPGPFAFEDPDYVAGLLVEAGWCRIEIRTEETTLAGQPTAAAAAEFAVLMGPASSLLREHHPDAQTREAIIAEVAEAFQPYAQQGAVVLPASVHFATALND